MEKENLIDLTAKLYRLTLLFPKKEPLRYKTREIADDILAKWIKRENIQKQSAPQTRELSFEIENEVEILNSFLDVAKWQNWVNFFEILEIQQEYDKIRDKIKAEAREAAPEMEPEKPVKQEVRLFERRLPVSAQKTQATEANALDLRKQRIMNLLKEKGKVQVQEAKKIFPDISKRTLRRDFQSLLKQGIIERRGGANETFYQIKGSDNNRTEMGFTMS